jgi:hypothetical protein
MREPKPTSGRSHAIGQRREQQGQPEQSEQDECQRAAILIGLHRPAAAERSQRRDRREHQRHADQHRQPLREERLVGAREDEGENRQDARADDRQRATEICQQIQDHGPLVLPARSMGSSYNASRSSAPMASVSPQSAIAASKSVFVSLAGMVTGLG